MPASFQSSTNPAAGRLLPAWMNCLPFRIGTTSYIIPADILPNVRYLADKVADIELVLFELDDGLNNLPTCEVLTELSRIGIQAGLSYTVHLPLDLRLGTEGEEQSLSLAKAQKVVQGTSMLEPWAYVLHLEGGLERFSMDPAVLDHWQTQAARALEIVAGWVGDATHLAVENLDGYPPEFNTPVLAHGLASRCIDIGHLWKDGHEPAEYLKSWLPRTRVIHLHGIEERDHQSLAHTPAARLDVVLKALLEASYAGVVTLELFSEEDLRTSLQAVQGSLQRLGFL